MKKKKLAAVYKSLFLVKKKKVAYIYQSFTWKYFTNGDQEYHWSCPTFSRGQQQNNCCTDYGWKFTKSA